MSESARPQPPRPRPRPRPAARPSGRPSSGGAAGPSKDPGTSVGDIVIKDSDDLFVINRGRTKETWKKLDEINKVVVRSTVDSESDGDGEPVTPSRKRTKKDTTPKWHRTQDVIQILSMNPPDDSDSDIELLSDPDTSVKGKKAAPSPKKRKHQMDSPRSHSITPPPELPAAVLLNARNVIRRALENPRRASSPIIIDDFEDSTEAIVLDPELARIANDISSQSASGQSLPKSSLESESLTITMRWRKHPLNVEEAEPTFAYMISRNEPFRELFEAIAEDVQILVQNLVVSHKNKRIYPSTTAQALGIWGEADFVGCHQNTWEYLRQQAREAHQSPVVEEPTSNIDVIYIRDDDDDDETAHSTDMMHHVNTQESDAESELDDDKFKLVLRSNKSAKDIAVIVRPTTKCIAIIRTFLKKAGLEDQYPHVFAEGDAPQSKGKRGRRSKAQALPDPRLSVDGDKMDNDAEIGTADLDDGDMVEVVGL